MITLSMCHKITLASDTLTDFQIKFSISISETVTHWFTLIALSALRHFDNENTLSLMNLILRSILTDLQEVKACSKLIARFKEREENVKMDIFNTFIDLLRQTGNVTKGQIDIDKLSRRWALKQEVPKVVKSINRQLREKSIKTK
nr:cullin-associated NEDD8-dissociated protein 1 [Tanacetum cinerariifolium]